MIASRDIKRNRCSRGPSPHLDRIAWICSRPEGLVHERILRRCRACVQAAEYFVTLHAADEMDANGYDALDLEAGILSGTLIEAQRDSMTRERSIAFADRPTWGAISSS